MQAMKTTTPPMPNDPEILQKMMAQMQAKLDSQESLIATLRHQLAVLKRSRFGRSSEQMDKQIHQLELQLEELEIHAAELPELDLGERAENATPRRRKQFPKHLPREETHVEAPPVSQWGNPGHKAHSLRRCCGQSEGPSLSG